MTVATARPTILIVENDEETRHLYADILQYAGASILEVGNPYEAFEQLRSRPVNVIVTDIGMPGGRDRVSGDAAPRCNRLPDSCDYRARRGTPPSGRDGRRRDGISGKAHSVETASGRHCPLVAFALTQDGCPHPRQTLSGLQRRGIGGSELTNATESLWRPLSDSTP